jgi:hypothetical protein
MNLGGRNSGGARSGIAGTTNLVLSSIMNTKDCGNIWIGDIGASCHYCSNNDKLYTYSIISEEITVGNGSAIIARIIGKLH